MKMLNANHIPLASIWASAGLHCVTLLLIMREDVTLISGFALIVGFSMRFDNNVD